MVDEGLRLMIQGLTPFALRATALERTHRAPPPTSWGRIEVGEASDDCLAPKRGFPLPNLPHVGEGILSARSSHAIALRSPGAGFSPVSGATCPPVEPAKD